MFQVQYNCLASNGDKEDENTNRRRPDISDNMTSVWEMRDSVLDSGHVNEAVSAAARELDNNQGIKPQLRPN